jgi:hypothetical protein
MPKEAQNPAQTVTLDLTIVSGDAFALMGAFSLCARCEGWTKEEIDAVLLDCQSGDYDHLVGVLSNLCVPPAEEEE